MWLHRVKQLSPERTLCHCRPRWECENHTHLEGGKGAHSYTHTHTPQTLSMYRGCIPMGARVTLLQSLLGVFLFCLLRSQSYDACVVTLSAWRRPIRSIWTGNTGSSHRKHLISYCLHLKTTSLVLQKLDCRT